LLKPGGDEPPHRLFFRQFWFCLSASHSASGFSAANQHRHRIALGLAVVYYSFLLLESRFVPPELHPTLFSGCQPALSSHWRRPIMARQPGFDLRACLKNVQICQPRI